jgi:uncharacterized protein YfaS (alpha-2-macroglobulin family)
MTAEVDFGLREGDTSPPLRVELQDDTGTPVDLTNASVSFQLYPVSETTATVDSSATVTDAQNGIVEYQWQTGETDTAGYYNAVFKVEYQSGTIETFPNNQFIVVKIDSLP